MNGGASFERPLHTKTYIYIGHGDELLDSKRLTVPDNCTLSTITEVGFQVHFSHVLNLCDIAKKHKDLLNDPVPNKKELSRLIHGGNANYADKDDLRGSYNIKSQGDKYRDKICDFLANFVIPETNQVAIFRSGLYDIDDIDSEFPGLPDGNIIQRAVITFDRADGISIKNIRNIYKNSLYPTVDSILQNLTFENGNLYDPIVSYEDFIRSVKKETGMTVSQLMDERPGNHNYFLCRQFPDQLNLNQLNALNRERDESRNRSNYLPVNQTREQNFVKLMHKIYYELTGHKTSSYKTIFTYIEAIFSEFINRDMGVTDVNIIISKINSALEKNEINIKVIDKILLRLMVKTHSKGSIKLVY
jgi:hypothetical protein